MILKNKFLDKNCYQMEKLQLQDKFYRTDAQKRFSNSFGTVKIFSKFKTNKTCQNNMAFCNDLLKKSLILFMYINKYYKARYYKYQNIGIQKKAYQFSNNYIIFSRHWIARFSPHDNSSLVLFETNAILYLFFIKSSIQWHIKFNFCRQFFNRSFSRKLPRVFVPKIYNYIYSYLKMQQQQQQKNGNSETVKNYYQILQLNPNATLRQIEKAYQRLALKWHPDKHTADRKLAQRKFHQVSEAYDTLSDHNKRCAYDQMINQQWSLQNAYKTFDQFFGQNQMVDQEQQKFFEKHYPQKKKNYYKILGVNKNATMKEITDAYRKLALKYHPKSNPNNEQAKQKFVQINEAYQTLSNQSKRSTYDDLAFGQLVPRRAHDIFQNFFENRWMDIPTEVDFFKPIFDRRGRLSDRWGLGNWSGMESLTSGKGGMNEQLSNIKEGQSYYKQEKYEKKGGKQNHTSQIVKKKIKNGQVEQEILKENILPNGQKQVTKMIKKGDKVVDTKNYHLRRDQKMPKELTNF